MNSCLNEQDLERYILGDKQSTECAALEEHIQACPKCKKRVDEEFLFSDVSRALRSATLGDSCGPEIGEDQVAIDGGPIAGYRILSELHRGGQGIVYKATQTATNRVVALKVLLRGALATERQRRRFEREIDVVASLKHPQIVTIYDSGTSRNRYFYAMEYIEGQPLDEFVRTQRLDSTVRSSKQISGLRQNVEMFRRICDAVNHAHQRGVIHRDLKPGNILIDQDGDPYVLDFGLAKYEDEESDRRDAVFKTQHGEFLGTLAYASPEQTYGEPALVDIRSDVYSLGVMLYELLTQRRPYDVDGDLSLTLRNIRETEPCKPSAFTPSIDNELETIVLKALSKVPNRRYQSAHGLAADLNHYLLGEAIDAKRTSSWYMLRKSFRRHRLAFVTFVSFFSVITIAMVVSTVLWRQAVADRNQAVLAGQAAAKAQSDAERQRKLALSQREVAISERAEAEFQAYAANIAAADAAFRVFDVADAKLRLDRAGAGDRNWEWGLLVDQLDTSSFTMQGHEAYIENFRILNNKGWGVSVAWDETLRFWNLESGKQIQKLELGAPGWSIAVSPDESLVAVGDWNTVTHVYDVEKMEELFQVAGPIQRVSALAFTPDSTQLAMAYWAFGAEEMQTGSVLHFVDLKSQAVEKRMRCRSAVDRILFHEKSGQFATVDKLGTEFWDIATLQPIRSIDEELLAFSSNGQTFVCGVHNRRIPGANAAYSRLEVREFQSNQTVSELRGHSGRVFAAEFSRDGSLLVTGARDKSVCLWDVDSGNKLKTFLGHQWTVTSVTFDSGQEFVYSASWDNTIKAWEIREDLGIPKLRAHDESITDLKINSAGTVLASSSRNGEVRLWDMQTRDLLATLDGHEQVVQSVAFSLDGQKLASASWDGTLKIWDLEQQGTPITLSGHTDLVLGVAFHPSGSWLVSSSRDNAIKIWDAKTGDEIGALLGHDDHAHSVVFTTSGELLASCGHRSIRLWDFAKREQITSFPRSIIQEDYSLAFDPEDEILVAGLDSQRIGFWNVQRRAPIEYVRGHTDEILTICFNGDGSRMVSASIDGAVRIWDTQHRTALCTLQGYEGRAKRLAFSRDGKYLITGMDNGDILFWSGSVPEK